MAKPVLGRDLGTLMGEKPAEKGARPSDAPLGGAGVDSLLRGQRPAASPEPPQPKPFPRAYLFAADVLLVILALRRAARQLSERPVVDLRDSGATTAEPVLPAGTIVN